MRKEKFLPVAAGVVTCTIFGLSFLFSKKALGIVDPFELLSFRFLLAFLVMSALVMLKVIKINYKGKNMKNLILLSIMQPIIYFIFETYGIKFSSSSQAGMMIALIPIVVAIMSSYFLKEKPSVLQWTFICLSVLGVMFIVLMSGSGTNTGTTFGTLLLLGAVVSGSAFNILSRKYSIEFTPMELTYSMMALATVVFNGISIFLHIRNNTLSSYFEPLMHKDFLSALVYLGILSSIIAFFLINYTLSKIEASKSAVLANLSTIVSIIAGVIFLNEPFHLYHMIGAAMILIGVWGTNYFTVKVDTVSSKTSSITEKI